MSDPFDDDLLAAALRRRAEQLAGEVPTERALVDVRRRATRRRLGRTVMAGAIAASAVAVLAGGVALIGDDGPVLRTPATQPGPSVAPPTSPTAPTTDLTLPASAAPTTAALDTIPPATAAPLTVPPAAPAPDIPARTYSGAGGSVTVAVSDGVLALVEDPSPASGYAVGIDDNGPSRVRVRFEDGQRRTEIRVDLEGGVLVPRVDES